MDCVSISARAAGGSTLREYHWRVLAARWPATRSTSLPDEEEPRPHRASLQRPRLLRVCVAYIQRYRYAALLWLPPQDPAAKPPPNRRPVCLSLHCAAARYARLRSVPRQPNPLGKEQHQENSRSSLSSSFSPYCSLIKGTRLVSGMLARRADRRIRWTTRRRLRVRDDQQTSIPYLSSLAGSADLRGDGYFGRRRNSL